jgi:hypothetical protein
MLRRVALVVTNVSEELSTSIIKGTTIGEPILVTLMMETSVLTTATRRNIPEDVILRSHRRGNLKSCIALTGWALQRRRNVSPVKYELGLYIPEDAIFHNHCRENLKSYIAIN